MFRRLPILSSRLRSAVCGLLLSGLALLAQAAPALALDDRLARVQASPALTMLSDPSRALSLDAVLDQRDRFEPPVGARGSLGLRRDAVWLRLPVNVAPDSDGRWILDLDYAVLNRVDVHLVAAGAPVRHWVLGNLQPRAGRPMTGRSHAVPLDLAPGSTAEIFLRVETAGAMILPITLSKAPAFHARAVNEQMLQGLLTGLGLFLVLYSLAQWISVREPMFPKYALLTSGSLLFSVAQFGLGAQYLWGDHLWFERHVPGIAALLASTGTFLFVEEVLAGDRPRRWFSRLMHAGAAALLLVAAAFALGLIDVRTVTVVVGTLGLAPALLGLPGAIGRLRRGDSVGGYFIAAWLAYFASTWVMVALIEGRLPANAWTLHSFQIGATLDMLLFLRVIALRLAAIHAEAQSAARERETLRSLAHTDPLTGLPNRRGLVAQIDGRLAHARPERLLALYMLDLDGFKQVNDRHGHDSGDQLLVAVAARLRESLREQDLIARLGGDEFVVVADDLRGATQAEAVGRHLLQAFAAPFEVAGQPCSVGLTAGYVLAPLDGRDARELLKAADAAMYAAKQDGKNRVRRAGLTSAAGACR
jgi:diguanylate cyclase (GGDEF)-like protein